MNNDFIFRVIGYGADASGAIAQLASLDHDTFDGLQACMACECDTTPADNNRIAVIAAAGNYDDAAATAAEFRRRGIPTVMLATEAVASEADATAVMPAHDFARAITILADMVFRTGPINIDFEDLLTLIQPGADLRMFEATGSGYDNPVANAVEALDSEIGSEIKLCIKALIICVYFSPAAKLKTTQAHAISQFITGLNPDIDVKWGLAYDDALPPDTVRISVIARM